MARLRLHYFSLPRPAVCLLDTPRPKCPTCRGDGYWGQDERNDYDTDEHLDAGIVTCGCWDPDRFRCLLVVPRWIARRWLGWTPPEDEDAAYGAWQPGPCDHCDGNPVDPPAWNQYCACLTGRGADRENCLCGPAAALPGDAR
ncbi:hypothetical protein [Kitasatospora sp. NPDC059827]|uniref:hypothetical protein n=1 Tax=Kitasatospora sp. NPDC059827 TaxID=3346964 RepID=UPI00364C2117